jgi:DNA-directed RNA polymerase specialized sigma24 family protein
MQDPTLSEFWSQPCLERAFQKLASDHRMDHDDLVGETACRLLNKVCGNSSPRPANILAYTVGIAKTVARTLDPVTLERKNKKRREVPLTTPEAERAKSMSSNESDQARLLISSETLTTLTKLISPEMQLAALESESSSKGVSAARLATVLDVSIPTARKRLAESKRQVLKILDRDIQREATR